MAHKKTYNPCDDCTYSYSKNSQESGMCKICELEYFKDRLLDVRDACKQSEWISVEERLPEKSGYYLICQKSSLWCEEIIQTARWNISSQRFRGAQAGCFMDNVTHWMPLPEAPKMKGGAE